MNLEEMFEGTPIVTKCILLSTVFLAAGQSLGLFQPEQLFYSQTLVFREQEYWRLITSLLYLGPLNINLFFSLNLLVTFSGRLESHFYYRRSAEYLWLLLIGASLLLFTANFVEMPFGGRQLSIIISYWWSKRNPQERAVIFFVIAIPATFLPVVDVVFAYLGSGWNGVCFAMIGLAIAHTLFYLADVFPLITGLSPVKMPKVLRSILRW